MTIKREAELELDNLRLRDAVKWALANITEEPYEWTCEEDSDAHRAALELVATEPSTEALAALVEKVQKLTIEQCAKAVWNSKPSQKAIDEVPAAYQLAALAAIRALPTGQIKLEDLL